MRLMERVRFTTGADEREINCGRQVDDTEESQEVALFDRTPNELVGVDDFETAAPDEGLGRMGCSFPRTECCFSGDDFKAGSAVIVTPDETDTGGIVMIECPDEIET